MHKPAAEPWERAVSALKVRYGLSVHRDPDADHGCFMTRGRRVFIFRSGDRQDIVAALERAIAFAKDERDHRYDEATLRLFDLGDTELIARARPAG